MTNPSTIQDTVSFDITRGDSIIVQQIARRAIALAARCDVSYRMRDALMDITAVHANGCPLRLHELLNADDANFAHDIFGIRRHINRTSGKLEDCFIPRFFNAEACIEKGGR